VEILYRVVPAFYEEIAQALEKLYGTDAGATRVPAILHFGSWAGGDMDGNPTCTPRASARRWRASSR